jgi:ethanolamine utilization protein EutN
MQLCRVTGSTVATVKAPALRDFKLVRVRPEGEGGIEFVAVDPLGAGEGDLVLVALGTAARELEATAGAPTDATVVAIVDPTG